MSKLELSVAVGDYDRTRALIDGSVAIDGVDPVYMTLVPEEIFFRAFRAAEFDICELSLSSYTVKTAQDNSPYIAVPAFVSRAFRHTAIYVRTDRVKKPQDLKGRKVGLPEYQLTANVWARAPRRRIRRQACRHSYGSAAASRSRGGRRSLPSSFRRACASTMRRRARRFPACWKRARSTASSRRTTADFGREGPSAYRLAVSSNPVAVAKDYFRRTGIFPIMHLIAIRRTLAEKASMAAGRRVQGVRAGEGGRRRESSPTRRRPK